MAILSLWKEQSIVRKIFAFTLLIILLIVIGVGFYLLYETYYNEEKKPLHNESPSSPGYVTTTTPRNPDEEKIYIHFVPHTHDDVGWLKTVNQYYFGHNNTVQKACVQCIIDSVIKALEKSPDRKFIYVETAFLWKWWRDRNETQRKILKNLVDEGRLEIIGGGWSMNDEAVTHYQSIIDQFTWGFRRLNEMFGPEVRPRIGWQIDPFGHSREQASIFAQMGFDGLFFGRLDYQDKKKRLLEKSTEFIWRGSSSLGKSSNLFTSVLYNLYQAPKGFCFDILCGDVPINENNVDERVSNLLALVDQQASSYKTNNVLLTMGGDFTYEDAEMWFTNMDKLITYINEKKGVKHKALYSTPSVYLNHVYSKNLSWMEEKNDFFPYASDKKSYWTGYYSSRPALKYFERLGNNFLQITKQLSVIRSEPDSEGLQYFREAMGVMQHHDAVTGTEKQHVADDYAKILHKGFEKGRKIAEKALNNWMIGKAETTEPIKFHSCFLLNISSCDYSSESEKFVVTVYNPTSQSLNSYIRLPVNNSYFKVVDSAGDEIVAQINPIPEHVRSIPERSSQSIHELIFLAELIPPLGYRSFYIFKDKNKNSEARSSPFNKTATIEGNSYSISVGSQNEIVVKSSKSNLTFNQSFHYYEGMDDDHSSGAYVFRPKKDVLNNLISDEAPTIYEGRMVSEIHQKINDWVFQVIRIFKDLDYVEFDWQVGPIPVKDKIGKEVITRYSSNLKNKGEFYTDSNGREMIKRKLNYRPTWDLELEEPIAGNYYPVTTKLSIEDREANLRLSALTDRSQGGSSLEEGVIELMLHRRLLEDDGFGVGEPLQENAFDKGLVVRGHHYLIGGDMANKDKLISSEKELAIGLAMQPWIFITPTQLSFEEWKKNYKMEGDSLRKELPKNIRILTLEPWKEEGQVLLRLENFFEKNETNNHSEDRIVNLKDLFNGFNIEEIEEMILGGNFELKNVKRLHWKSENSKVFPDPSNKSLHNDLFRVEIKHMEIKTYVIKLTLNSLNSKD